MLACTSRTVEKLRKMKRRPIGTVCLYLLTKNWLQVKFHISFLLIIACVYQMAVKLLRWVYTERERGLRRWS